MKIILLFCVSILSFLSLNSCLEIKNYPTKFDDIDIDLILQNKRILKNYLKCFYDEGPCTADAKLLKAVGPDAIATTCAKCTIKQQNLVRKGLTFLLKNQPKDFDKIFDKYDPKNQHKQAILDFLNAKN